MVRHFAFKRIGASCLSHYLWVVVTVNVPDVCSSRSGLGWRSKDEQHLPGWSFAPFCLLDPKHHPQDVALPDQMAKNRFGLIAQKGKMSCVLGRYFEIDFPKSCHPYGSEMGFSESTSSEWLERHPTCIP